ncbi:MAG: ABC transporter permease [Spirochaetota bacterium]
MRWPSVVTLAVHDLRMLVTERGTFVVRLVMPIVFILVVGVANDAFQSGEPSLPRLEIVDRDGTALSAFLIDYVADRATGLDLCGAAGGTCGIPEDDFRSRLDSGITDIALVVPERFGATIQAGEPVSVLLVFAAADPEEASRLLPLARSAAQRTEAALSAGDAARSLLSDSDAETEQRLAAEAARVAGERALERLSRDSILIERERIALPDRHVLVGFQQSIPGMGSMFVMLSVLAGSTMLVEERRRWTLQRTLTTPVSHGGFVAGKIAGRFLIGMAQYAVAIVAGLVIASVAGVGLGSSPLLMGAVMASFVLAVAAISVLLATVVEREQQASGLTTLLAVTLAPIGGAWWSLDIEIVPEFMRRLARVSPFYWVMEGFRAAIHDLGFAAAALPIGVLLATALVAGLIASWRLVR